MKSFLKSLKMGENEKPEKWADPVKGKFLIKLMIFTTKLNEYRVITVF
jgi:hypothetical protein